MALMALARQVVTCGERLPPALESLSVSEGSVFCRDLDDALRAEDEVEELLPTQTRRVSVPATAGAERWLIGPLLADLACGLDAAEDALDGVHVWAHNPCDWIFIRS